MNSKNILLLFLLLAMFPCIVMCQRKPAWVEMSIRDAENLLKDSAWAQTQSDTDTSELFFSPTKPGTATIAQTSAPRGTFSDQQSINNNRAERGATNGSISVNYHVNFFSARPVREAISRVVLLNQVEPRPELVDLMQTLVDRDFSQFIVVTVTFDSTDGRFLGPAIQAFGSATTNTLRNATYLERKDGKRLYLMDYRIPQNDGLGAKFVFPRNVNGRPFLTAGAGTVRFYSEISKNLKLNLKYKVAQMVYNNRLEY